MSSLRIYLSRHCPVCREAFRLAGEVGRRLAHVSVEIIDVDDANAENVDDVCLVPTYMLDGRRISLGNPGEQELFTLLEGGNRELPK